MLFAGNFAPAGWAFCNGQLLPVSQNSALFAILGTSFGRNGVSTSGLPDLRARAPIHFGQGPGLQSYSVGAKGGVETVTLTTPEMPAHVHIFGLACNSAPGLEENPVNNFLGKQSPGVYTASSNAQMGGGTSSMAGGNQGHENRAPYLALNYVIALQGIFPTRS